MNFTQNTASNKIVCVGRNYADHAAELNNPIPDEPVLFIKPWTSICPLEGEIEIPKIWGEVHHELEIAFVIGEKLSNSTPQEIMSAITGIGLALDLTLREVQTQLKEKKYSWEKSKSFDKACPIECIPFKATESAIAELSLSLSINGETKQQGNTQSMLFKPVELIAHINEWFTLLPGDIVLTGTPAGVGALKNGDILESCLKIKNEKVLQVSSTII